MRIPSSGNVVAVVLAGLAVVLAASGTAYAVTTSRVTVADPVHPSYRVRVDSKGSLKVTGTASVSGRVSVSGPVTVTPPTSTIAVSGSFGFDSTTVLTSPTTATLAISSLSYSNPSLNSAYAGTNYLVTLVQLHVGDAGTCATGASGVYVARQLAARYVSPGDDIDTSFAAPLVVRPISGAKSCLGLSYFHLGGGTQTSLYSSTVLLTGYAVTGSYTGIGTAAHPARLATPGPGLLTR